MSWTLPACPAGVLSTMRCLTSAFEAPGSMRDRGEIGADVDADRAAAALLAGLQGGVVVLLATGSSAHLEIAVDTAIEQLRSSGRQAAGVRRGTPAAGASPTE